MICKALTLSIFFHLLLVCGSFGQQEYLSNNYGGPGTQQLYSRHVGGFDMSAIKAGGADTTWDVSALAALDLTVTEIITRDEAIDQFTFTALCALGGINVLDCFTIWNNTQQAWVLQDTQLLLQLPISNIKRFQRVTQTQLLENFLGFNVEFGGSTTPIAVVYQHPDTVLNFPVTYGSEIISRTAWSLDLSPTGQNIQFSSHQVRTTTVDGWGTLITPYDTLQGVLRVKAVIAHTDTLTTDSIALPITISQLEYTWYDTAYGLPVMIATGLMNDTIDVISAVSYVVDSICPDPTWAASTNASVYDIDEGTGFASVDFNVEMSNAGIYTWHFGDGNIESSSGNISHNYFNPGVYTVQVTGCMTNCLPLNSCTTQTLVIEVRDTTSAVTYVDPEAHGIRVYPNPAGESISFLLPADVGNMNFNMIDVSGRRVMSGEVLAGLNTLDISMLPAGIYALQLRETNKGTLYSAIRLVVTH